MTTPNAAPVGARREPLVRIDDPFVAVAHGAAEQTGRVGAGHLGLGHPEERARIARHERCEEALLLLRRAEHVEDLAVAGIRGLAPEDELRVHAAADLLVQVGVLEEAAPRAAGLGRQVRRPKACILRLLPQFGDERVGRLVLPLDRDLVRVDELVHERANALAALGNQVRDDNGRHRQQ